MAVYADFRLVNLPLILILQALPATLLPCERHPISGRRAAGAFQTIALEAAAFEESCIMRSHSTNANDG